MYVPPKFRCMHTNHHITNICDEFLHIEGIPEANINECCICKSCCIRKSVTCVAVVKNSNNHVTYSKVYKNHMNDDGNSTHAEMLFIFDADLRKQLHNDSSICMYLTYQPCHFSGGHYKVSVKSCTEALVHFYDKTLSPKNISLTIKFAYIYRAHWKVNCHKYEPMIENAKEGLKILKSKFNIQLMTLDDINELYEFCSESEKEKLDSSELTLILQNREKVYNFFKEFLDSIT